MRHALTARLSKVNFQADVSTWVPEYSGRGAGAGAGSGLAACDSAGGGGGAPGLTISPLEPIASTIFFSSSSIIILCLLRRKSKRSAFPRFSV
jgi:hypothetical protein